MSQKDVENVQVPGQGMQRVDVLPMRMSIVFSGNVVNGMVSDPDQERVFYPLGSSIVMRDVKDGGRQEFLTGHTYKIGCLAISKSGNFLASGESHEIGAKVSCL